MTDTIKGTCVNERTKSTHNQRVNEERAQKSEEIKQTSQKKIHYIAFMKHTKIAYSHNNANKQLLAIFA